MGVIPTHSVYYRPKMYYIDALEKWSQPKWHIRSVHQHSLFGPSGYDNKTLCGTTVKPNGNFSKHRPVVPGELCKKCFGP